MRLQTNNYFKRERIRRDWVAEEVYQRREKGVDTLCFEYVAGKSIHGYWETRKIFYFDCECGANPIKKYYEDTECICGRVYNFMGLLKKDLS